LDVKDDTRGRVVPLYIHLQLLFSAFFNNEDLKSLFLSFYLMTTRSSPLRKCFALLFTSISHLRPLPNRLLGPRADSLIQVQILEMHKQRIDKSKRPYARKASAWRALIRRAEDGTALSIERGQNKQRERKLFSDKSFNKHFCSAGRSGRPGLATWRLA
jgi:hypothetical protein